MERLMRPATWAASSVLVLLVALAALVGLDRIIARVAARPPPTAAPAADAEPAAHVSDGTTAAEVLAPGQESFVVLFFFVLAATALVELAAWIRAARRGSGAAEGAGTVGAAKPEEIELGRLHGHSHASGPTTPDVAPTAASGKGEGTAAAAAVTSSSSSSSSSAAAAAAAESEEDAGATVATTPVAAPTPAPSSHHRGEAPGDVRTVLRALVTILAAVTMMLLVDGPFPWHNVLAVAKLPYDRDLFLFVCLTVAVMGGLTLRDTHKHDTKPLQREQTDEWRGYMQIGFVLYHYFAAKEAYNLIRVFIASYVFLTGFGNFSFFWIRQDYSFLRVCKMLLRLNLLAVLICVAMNKPWMLYYVCPLHTFNFFLVYATMAIMPHKNTEPAWMFGKFVALFVVLVLLFEVPGVFDVVFAPLWPLMQFEDSLYEWRFRSTLDHYAVLWGMIVAYNFPLLERWLMGLETRPPVERRNIKAILAIVSGTALFLWFYFFFSMPKRSYNAIHPYVSIVPLLAMIVLRNFSHTARGKVLGVFQWSGRITLETYMLQFHIWLANDAKGLMQYINVSEHYLINFTIATAVYLVLSNWVFEATAVLNDALIPPNATLTQVARRVGLCAAVWAGIYLFVLVLRAAAV